MATPVPMDTSSNAGKRKIVGLDGNPVGSSNKRLATTATAGGKIGPMTFCLVAYAEFSNNWGVQNTMDPFLSMRIMKQVQSAFNAMRQDLNAGKGNAFTKFTEINFDYHTKNFSMKKDEAFKFLMIALRKAYQAEKLDSTHVASIQPIMALWCLFGERVAECRIAPDSVMNPGNELIKLSSYGIGPEFKHLCGGMSYSLPTKSAISQSLGPMTVVVSLVRQTQQIYAKKWIDAFKRMYSHIPESAKIADFLAANRPLDCVKIIGLLAQITNVVGSRQQHRLSFPPCAMYATYVVNTKDAPSEINPNIEKMDFSGHGGFFLYKIMQDLKFELPKGFITESKQVLFHSMLGTVGADLELLKRITGTGGNWLVRSQMNNFFNHVKGSTAHYECEEQKLIPLQYYSKLASATMTNLLRSNTEPAGSDIVFSGFTHKKLDSEFIKRLETPTVQQIGTATGESVLQHLTMICLQLKKQFDKNQVYDAGTVKWRKVDDLTLDAHGSEVDLEITEGGRIYWSNED